MKQNQMCIVNVGRHTVSAAPVVLAAFAALLAGVGCATRSITVQNCSGTGASGRYSGQTIGFTETERIRTNHWNFWYPTGPKSREGDYKYGRKHGRWESWYKNGQLASRGEYRNGEPEGIWHFWSDSGELLREENFEDELWVFTKKSDDRNQR